MTTSTRRPTILHIFSGDLWAGADVAIFNLLNQLRLSPEWSLVALALNDGILTRRLRGVGIETHVIPETATPFGRIWLAAHRLLTGRTMEIIHSHRYKENLLAVLLAKSLGVKRLVSTLHGLSEPLVRSAVRARATTGLDYLVLRRFFDRVVAVSTDTKCVLVRVHRFPDSRMEVIHNGVPLHATAPRPARTSDVLHIGSVGRMVPVKRFDLFLDVAAHVRMKTDRVRFSLRGDGPLRAELLAKSKALSLDDCVEFLPAQPDLLAYYRSLDIYVNTSLHEGLPLSILEAMACARPVVAAKVGGIPEIVSHGVEGLLVESSEPQDFARSCMTLVTNRHLRAAMGESAERRVVAHFGDTQMAEAYRNLYLELSQGPSASASKRVRTDRESLVVAPKAADERVRAAETIPAPPDRAAPGEKLPSARQLAPAPPRV